MRFAFTDDQQALKGEARRVLEKLPSWERIVALGWPGLAIPESYGGAGLGWVELCSVLEEAGRVLLELPLFSNSVAAQALLECGTEEQRREWLPQIAEGRARATLVADDGLALDGTDAGLFIFADRIATRIERVSVEPFDATRPLARVKLADEGLPLARPLTEEVRARALVALAAEEVGGAERCLEMAVEYAKLRHQFGRPIGSFQAIKHMCADMLVRVESARSACYWAAWTAAVGDGELTLAAPLAQSWCADAFFRNAADNLQIHGGIGFTWEHPAHRYLRRARASASLFGSAAHHREEVARRIGL
jgi:alkylation response protein AidB-like acyl-CoA dehydrogenase